MLELYILFDGYQLQKLCPRSPNPLPEKATFCKYNSVLRLDVLLWQFGKDEDVKNLASLCLSFILAF